jgi:phage shock protein A
MTAQYQQQLNDLTEQESLWSARAIKAKKQDEKKALQCVKRLMQTKKQITLLQQHQQHQQESSNQEKKPETTLMLSNSNYCF